jgi:uncharacterized protein (DUF433 family)
MVFDPEVRHGDPCIKGTRLPVSVMVGNIADGDTARQILDAWPELIGDDIRAALEFAAVTTLASLPLDRDGR